MSVINQIPFLDTLFSDLSVEELKTLRNCVNGQGGAPVIRTLERNSSTLTLLTSSDKGIKPIVLELNKPAAQQLYTGYLLYTDDACVVIAYASDYSPLLTIINIDMSKLTYDMLDYSVSITGLRSDLNDIITDKEGGSSEGFLKTYNAYELIGLTSLLGKKYTFTEDKPDEDGGFYYIHTYSSILGIPNRIASYDLPVNSIVGLQTGGCTVFAENIGNSKSKRVCFIGFYELVPGTSNTYQENATATIKVTNFKSIEFQEQWANNGSGASAFPSNGTLLNFITDGYVEVMQQEEM